MVQLHKRFTDSQIKELIERYLKREIERSYIQEVLGIGKMRFFTLIKAYRHNPHEFSIHYTRHTSTRRISQDVEYSILRELQIKKKLIENPDIPLRHHNYSYIRDLLKEKYHRNGTKHYDKVVERIGRLKEKYKLVSHTYKVSIEKDTETDKAKNITWSRKKTEKTNGIYCLRTDRKDLDEQKIWDVYTMLTDIEDAFRCMKSELGLRPIYHQKETRCDGHIFITLLAYHLLHAIRFKLRQKGVRFCWTTICKQLLTQVRVNTTMKRKDGKIIHIRKSSKAEPSHEAIYDALNLPHQPGRTVKAIL